MTVGFSVGRTAGDDDDDDDDARRLSQKPVRGQWKAKTLQSRVGNTSLTGEHRKWINL